MGVRRTVSFVSMCWKRFSKFSGNGVLRIQSSQLNANKVVRPLGENDEDRHTGSGLKKRT